MISISYKSNKTNLTEVLFHKTPTQWEQRLWSLMKPGKGNMLPIPLHKTTYCPLHTYKNQLNSIQHSLNNRSINKVHQKPLYSFLIIFWEDKKPTLFNKLTIKLRSKYKQTLTILTTNFLQCWYSTARNPSICSLHRTSSQ